MTSVAHNLNGRYIDAEYLREQVPLLAMKDANSIFADGNHSLNPTRYFLTEWYAWQNPDWSSEHNSPYEHYLNVGRFEGRDPSPYVDMVRFRQAIGPNVPASAAYDLLLTKQHAPWLGVYDGPNDLRRMQDRFFRNISVDVLRSSPVNASKKYLVFLQSGRGALTQKWLSSEEPRNWDLMLNYYDSKGFIPHLGEYVFFQKGTKFTAMWALWQNCREIFEEYDYVLFLDDDVETSVCDLNRAFENCSAHQLDLAQMTLTKDSFSNWSQLFDQPEYWGPRKVSSVEIMMPILSRRALAHLAPTFGKSVSGFGLDLTWGHLVRGFQGNIAVLDGISATHARPVDQNGGSYYAYLRSHGINAKAELWALIKEYGASRDFLSD